MVLWQLSLIGPNGLDPTTLTPTDIYQLILTGLEFAIGFAGVVAFVYLVIAGVQYIFAAGNEGKQGEAKKSIQSSVIGLIVITISFTLVYQLLQRLEFNDRIINSSPELQNGGVAPYIQR